MPLEPGAVDSSGNFTNPDCMAKDIFDAMNQFMPLPDLPPDTLDDIQRKQRLFALAVSTGVISYLKRHGGDSFLIQATVTPSNACTVSATLTID